MLVVHSVALSAVVMVVHLAVQKAADLAVMLVQRWVAWLADKLVALTVAQ